MEMFLHNSTSLSFSVLLPLFSRWLVSPFLLGFILGTVFNSSLRMYLKDQYPDASHCSAFQKYEHILLPPQEHGFLIWTLSARIESLSTLTLCISQILVSVTKYLGETKYLGREKAYAPHGPGSSYLMREDPIVSSFGPWHRSMRQEAEGLTIPSKDTPTVTQGPLSKPQSLK